MNKTLIFNWKMFPQSLSEVRRLTRIYGGLTRTRAEIVIAPPFVYLPELLSVVGGKSLVKLGAQNVFWEEKGAYTGEISPKMLKDLGVEYAIIGHSERRKYIGETDEIINKKVKAALKAGLKVILCVGEPTNIRKKGKKAAMNFIKTQLQKDLKAIKKLSVVSLREISRREIGRRSLVIAYEPIWAIGTGIPAHPNDALEMIKFIKKLLTANYQLLTPKVLYGGSVDSKNILSFVKHNEIDGALVGGASIKIKEFKKIVEKISKLNY